MRTPLDKQRTSDKRLRENTLNTALVSVRLTVIGSGFKAFMNIYSKRLMRLYQQIP